MAVRALPPPTHERVRPTAVVANATLVARADVGASVGRFRIRPDDPSEVVPGQYRSLGLMVDGRLVQRPYSAATPAGRHAELEFLVRLVPCGTFTPLLWALRPGDRLRIGPPKGRFTLLPGDARTHLFIATGTGIAPFIAMLETLQRERRSPRTVVVHGVSHAHDLAYRERLDDLAAAGAIAYEPAISRPDDAANLGWTGRVGRAETILDQVWADHGLQPDDTTAYLCGNPEMIGAGERVLAARGLPPDAIRSEHYWPA